MNYVYGIAILCVIMMFLIVLALYRLHTLDKIQKECDKKIGEINKKYWIAEEEKAKLRTFKEITENIITGKRTPEEKVEKIKELLFDRNNNSH